MNSIYSDIEEIYYEAFFSLRIFFVVYVVRVLVFVVLERRFLVSKFWIGFLLTSGNMLVLNVVYKFL